MPGEATRVSLSMPLRGGHAEDRAQHEAGVLRRRHAGRAGAEHARGLVEEALHVEAHDRRGHHAEVRERRVAAADGLHAGEDVAEAVGPRLLLEVRAGIGDRDEAAGRLVGAHDLLHAIEEVRLEDVGLQRGARLAGHDEERSWPDRPSPPTALTCAGSVESRTCSSGKPGTLAEGLLPDLRAEARSAHAEEQGVGEAFLLDLGPELREGGQVVELPVDDPDPADPARLVAARPQRGVARPQAARAALGVPVREALGDLGLQVVGQRVGLRVDARAIGLAAAALDRLQELGERLHELLEAVGQELVGDLLAARSRTSRGRRACPSRRRGPPRGSAATGRGRGRRRASPAERC